MNKSLSISIVIPVYNEEHHIKACLEAIANQTLAPLEVIVVDNNSTDKTVKTASKYKFVKILHEPRQHQAFAQALGFDNAKGDILARIDGDSILPVDWVRRVLAEFVLSTDLAAVTGLADPYDVPLKTIGVAIFRFYHTRLTKLMSGKTMLWGANCAFRAKYWPLVKKDMLIADNIWEDYEMSYWLANLGKVKLMPDLKVGCSFRSAHKGFFEQLRYQFRSIRVFGRHNNKPKTIIFFFAWYSMIPIFILAMIDNYLWLFQNRKKLRTS